MLRKAELADGTRPGLPLVSPRLIQSELERARHDPREWSLRRGSNPVDPWRVLLAWLLRHVGGQTQAEVACRIKVPEGSLTRLERCHRELLRASAQYERVATRVAKECFARVGSG
jgi:hypothetical protein